MTPDSKKAATETFFHFHKSSYRKQLLCVELSEATTTEVYKNKVSNFRTKTAIQRQHIDLNSNLRRILFTPIHPSCSLITFVYEPFASKTFTQDKQADVTVRLL
jgi:hypothetical protein